MNMTLTHKQKLLLRTAGMAAAVYLVFQYLIPLLLPFLIAVLLAIPIRPAARFLYKKFHIPMGAAAVVVLGAVLTLLGTSLFFLGKMAVEQLMRLADQLPVLWVGVCEWLMDCCGNLEQGLHLNPGTITAKLNPMTGSLETMGSQAVEVIGGLLGSSLQGVAAVLRTAVTVLVTVFVTIGATLITTTQLESLRCSLDRSLFRREIRQVIDTLARVGTAYGKTQLIIMACTVVVSAVGLTLLGDPYALLWAAVIGLVDALPLFGAGTILWPWLILSALRGQLLQTVGLAVIYGISNLTRQWLEARYMGDRIGLSALENLIAMYLGLQLFGILGLFWGPIGYLLIKEASQGNDGTGIDNL